MKPDAVLIEQAVISHHLHFDSVPYANMRIVDVARILDGETARPTLNGAVIAKLLDRLMTALTHTLLSMEGRPESTRLAKLINRGMNRLLSRIPEITKDMQESVFVCTHTLALRADQLYEGIPLNVPAIGSPSPALASYLKQRDAQMKKLADKSDKAHKSGYAVDKVFSDFVMSARDKLYWKQVNKTPIK